MRGRRLTLARHDRATTVNPAIDDAGPADGPAGIGPAGDGDVWVFGYGSLMWRPGFPYLAVEPALLRGYHRAFCVYSVRYRGTPECPGLVTGLDRGGSCRGRAFRVAAANADAVRTYLDDRELVTGVYVRRIVPVELPGGTVTAWTYVVDRTHRQYAGNLPLDEAARVILGGRGTAGNNRDYLENTVAHLDDLGISDGPAHKLWRLVEKLGRE